MTAPRRSGAEQATMRGIIVLVVAVLIGVGLLSKSDAIVGSAEASNGKPSGTTTTTAAGGTTSLPPGTAAPVDTGDSSVVGARPPAEVQVIVINAAGGIAGVGQANSDLLTAAGFNVFDIKNAAAAPTTTIYFAEGYQADAEAVKAALTTTAAVVAPNPAAPIIPEAADANVSVVIGQDYSPPA